MCCLVFFGFIYVLVSQSSVSDLFDYHPPLYIFFSSSFIAHWTIDTTSSMVTIPTLIGLQHLTALILFRRCPRTLS